MPYDYGNKCELIHPKNTQMAYPTISHMKSSNTTRLSMEVLVTSKLVYFTYLGDVSNLLI